MTDTVNVDLTAVIGWLENGCAVEPAITELKIYQARLAAAQKADHVPDASNMIEAPKVEQEPVGQIDKVIGFAGDTAEVVWTDKMPPIGTKIYTHPAPASDELLEALAPLANMAAVVGNGGDDSVYVGQSGHRLTYGDFRRAASVYAKHKGPQS